MENCHLTTVLNCTGNGDDFLVKRKGLCQNKKLQSTVFVLILMQEVVCLTLQLLSQQSIDEFDDHIVHVA